MTIDRLLIENDWDLLTEWGFSRGETIDEYYCSVLAPEGWTLRPHSQKMWLSLYDQNGLSRGVLPAQPESSSLPRKGMLYRERFVFTKWPFEHGAIFSTGIYIFDRGLAEQQPTLKATEVFGYLARHKELEGFVISGKFYHGGICLISSPNLAVLRPINRAELVDPSVEASFKYTLATFGQKMQEESRKMLTDSLVDQWSISFDQFAERFYRHQPHIC